MAKKRNNKKQEAKKPQNELVGGIELALSRGEKLNNIMLSFYNSGYPRNEIEKAARIAQRNIIQKHNNQLQDSQQNSSQQNSGNTQKKSEINPKNQQKLSTKKISQYGQESKKKTTSESSNKKHTKKWIIFLIIGLLVLAGIALVGLLFFKDQITSIFS